MQDAAKGAGLCNVASCRLLRLGDGWVVEAEDDGGCWGVAGSVVAAGLTHQVPRAVLADEGEMPAVGGERSQAVGEPVEPPRRITAVPRPRFR
jgi:hypothetical protein